MATSKLFSLRDFAISSFFFLIIYITKEKDIYEIKFKSENYNNEVLFLFTSGLNNIILDNCYRLDNLLTCKIDKGKIESITFYNHYKNSLVYIYLEEIGLVYFPTVLEIEIINNIIQKAH